MPICIHRRILGTPMHLVFDEDYEWHRDIPDSTWVFSNYCGWKCLFTWITG